MIATMKAEMKTVHQQLAKLLEQSELTSGMYIRVHGENLIMGRTEENAPASPPLHDDRARLTRLSSTRYGLSG
jgi:hypothetical protein